MGSYSRTYSFTDGTTAYGSQVVFELDALGTSVNNIVNAQIASGASIADAKLAQITTAGKVSGAALTLLANVPSGAGELPAANLNIASQAEQETGTDTETLVVSGRQHFHPSAGKGWVKFDGSSGSIGSGDASYNVTSVADNGTGDYTVNWATDFSSANYATAVACGITLLNLNVVAQAAGTTQVNCDVSSTDTPNNGTYISVIAFGDHS